jgi:hypothetical protein
VTVMVYATGGIRSIYSAFYPLVIIYSVLFLGKKGGVIIASIAAIFYGLLADLEFYKVLQPIMEAPMKNDQLNADYALARIITHIFSFYLTAYLASFLVEQERKAVV